MQVWPAIDILNGEAVRLTKGDYASRTVYFHDPNKILRFFEENGTSYLHIVDLDGALTGENVNFDVIRYLASNSRLTIEVGGGIRDERRIEAYLSLGISRVILGTIAVKDPVFVERMARHYPHQIVVGVDERDGKVSVSGWTKDTSLSTLSFCQDCVERGIEHLIVTDISKDGMLQGTNLSLYQQLHREVKASLTASGGITHLSEIRELKAMGIEACIVGKAIYEGKLDLKEAIRIAGE